jgi:uracil phosphoribosyltransferase
MAKTKKKTAKNPHPTVTILEHPVLQHKLSILRDKNISSMAFRQIVEEMSQMMAYEATRDLQMGLSTVETPPRPSPLSPFSAQASAC